MTDLLDERVEELNERVEALFASDLQCSEQPGTAAVRAAVDRTQGRFGKDGCSALVAVEFGDHPDCACRRMAWVRAAVAEAFAPPPA